jgi:hypothetical protein
MKPIVIYEGTLGGGQQRTRVVALENPDHLGGGWRLAVEMDFPDAIPSAGVKRGWVELSPALAWERGKVLEEALLALTRPGEEAAPKRKGNTPGRVVR